MDIDEWREEQYKDYMLELAKEEEEEKEDEYEEDLLD